MATIPASSSPAIVIDANVMIALCAKETDKYAMALAQIQQYVHDGFVAYAPGGIVMETLYALCRKLQDGFLTTTEHAQAVQHFEQRMLGILPPPNGEASLVARAEQIRGTYSCRRSADALYIALAEELTQMGSTELVTFDADLQKQAAAAAPSVVVRLLMP